MALVKQEGAITINLEESLSNLNLRREICQTYQTVISVFGVLIMLALIFAIDQGEENNRSSSLCASRK